MSHVRSARTPKRGKSELADLDWQARFATVVGQLTEALERLVSDLEIQRELIELSPTFPASDDHGVRHLSDRLDTTAEVMRALLTELQAMREAEAADDRELTLMRLADAGG